MKKLFSIFVVLAIVLSVFVACNPDDVTPEEPTYLYNDFTAEEKAIFNDFLGEVIPFFPANQYEVEFSDGVIDNIDYYVIGITRTEFDGYRNLLTASGYLYKGTESDPLIPDSDIWYVYKKGDIGIDLCFFFNEEYNLNVADIYVYRVSDIEDDTPGEDAGGDIPGEDVGGDTPGENVGGDTPGEDAGGDTPGGNNPGGDTPANKTYTDFSSGDKEMFTSLVGEVIPFIPNDEYEVMISSDEYGTYVYFSTVGNTTAEFEAYLDKLEGAGYSLFDTESDEDNDTWYYYEKGTLCIDLVHYLYEGTYYLETFTYVYDENDDNEGGNTPGEDVGGDTPGEDVGGDTPGGNTPGGDQGGTPSDVDLIVNDGKGLPTGTNGVHNVDFSTATNVKNVHDQGYYLDGCPSTGTTKVLVIPVDFVDVTASSKGYDVDNIDFVFSSKNSTDDVVSVYEYFYASSYGKLTLDFTVLDNWFRPKNNSSYYANSTDSEGYMNGDQLIIDEALQHLSTIMDLSDFDSDDNGIIDAVVIVHTLDIDENSDFYWAYRYWNYHVDSEGYYYEYDGVSANDYLWASYQFLHESYDEDGNTHYDDTSVINSYTFIHEFSHVLGADDYYDTAYVNQDGLLAGMDMMDSMFGDHNPYTKFNYGWITTSRLVTTNSSVTLTLKEFGTTGDTIIIANNWDDNLGAYQEYYVLMYYTNNGLNAGDDMGYFSRDGIVVYHVNASLYREVYDGETFYDVYNNNTDASFEGGTVNNLIEYVKTAGDTYTYIAGDTMSKVTTDNGDALIYNFVVDSINGDTATITFTKSN